MIVTIRNVASMNRSLPSDQKVPIAALIRVVFMGIAIVVLAAKLTPAVFAEDCDTKDLSNCNEDCLKVRLSKCTEAFSSMEAAKKPHVENLRKMDADIAAFQARIKTIEGQLVVKAQEIQQGEKELADLLTLANKRIRQFYIRSSHQDMPILTLISSPDFGEALRILGYNRSVTNEDKKVITQTAVLVKELQVRKTALETERTSLSALKTDIDKKAESVRKLVAEANAYEAKLSSTIASITARQQELLAQKLASLGIPLYAMSGGGCSSDLTNGKNPGFSGGFGFFSFGVPNRVGLNQYGAWGRAKAGQNYETILRAYYTFDSISDVDKNTQIKVEGYGNYSLEDYMNRIYEVPDSWADNDLAALKAQAIAVRSYVMAYTNNGQGSICTTQQCQVFQPNAKGGNWERAVRDTAGKVMMQGGRPIKAYFSSTHGGYAYNTGDLQGWSSTSYTKRMVDTANGSVSGFSDLKNNAYDKDSPWFYCDWGGRSQYGGTAWLKPEEVADIVNVYLLAQRDSSSQKHLTQPDKPNPDGVDTWDAGTVRSKLGGDAYSSIDNVSVNADFGSGRTTQVTLSGNGKSTTINGTDFKTYFNLRAPASIQIVGPLFNVERK
jgi:SpoIID/LytB domain protein